MRGLLSIFIISSILTSCVSPSSDSENDLIPSGGSSNPPQTCTFEGNWNLKVQRLEANSACAMTDCGYGANPNCSVSALGIATTNVYQEVTWEVFLAFLVGKKFMGTYDATWSFNTTHESFSNSYFDGQVDETTCTVSGTLIWAPNGYSCYVEVDLTGEKI